MSGFAKYLAGTVSGFGSRRKLIVLTYHRVLSEADDFVNDVTVDSFEEHVRVIGRHFSVLRLDRAAQLLKERRLPAGAVCITFDDGYADNYEFALPILKKYSVPATFFVATGFLDGGIMWNDIVRQACREATGERVLAHLESEGVDPPEDNIVSRVELMHKTIDSLKYQEAAKREEQAREFAERLSVIPSSSLMMSSEQVAELARAGMEVGAHTVSHPILKKISLAQARDEIHESRTVLQQVTGQEIQSFAFPNGRPEIDFDRAHLLLIKESGFSVAVTTRAACAGYGDPLFELPRLSLWDTSVTKILLRLANYYLRY